MGYEWLALIAAALWASTSLISVTPARHLGAFSYSRWRMAIVSTILATISLMSGGWHTLSAEDIAWLAISGGIGIFIGDTALFACMNRMGPRRANLLFTCNALFSVLFGIVFFNEQILGWQLLGAVLLFIGVALAILFGRRARTHLWESIHGSLMIAIGLGLLAALCQSLGAVLAKPAMQGSADPISASLVRMSCALLCHLLLWWQYPRLSRSQNPINRRIFSLVFANGFLAMAVGMTLILYALRKGDVGMIALLSATTPIMILPMLWFYTKEAPTRSAWAAAALTVIGSGLLLG
ncbi:DMT family transporter [Celerinatantimonas yamalensis]|uniref:DMT family transporter n=1 Tax=Celerinatantimonas yamalensis TaxID=559956 RepID=A0ABW9G8U5_9GAMM